MVIVKKLDGSKQKYNEKKLLRSLTRAGATEQIARKIAAIVRKQLFDGISTKKIFRPAFKEYRKLDPVVAPRYDLKQALLRFGKSGFPFEAFIERIMTLQGYDCQRNINIRGKLIPHEIDVIAKKGNEILMIECKHHGKPWLGSSIQTALYVYARFLDSQKHFTTPMVATNTKFSPQVVTYAKGMKMKLLGWNYPRGGSLEKLIDRHRAFPITLLPSVNQGMIDTCLKNNILLVSDIHILSPEYIAKVFKITPKKASQILKECKICEK